MEIENLKEEIELLKNRNKVVDLNKAWETSYTRKITVALTTYLVMVIIFFIADIENYFFNALIPTLGFLLSTLSVQYVKEYWIKQNRL